MFKETKPIRPLRGQPLDWQEWHNIIIQYEDRMFPHLEYHHSEEVMQKEVHSGKWTPASAHAFGSQIMRFANLLMP